MTPAVKMAEDAGVDFRLHRYQHDPGAESYGLEAAELLDLDPRRVFKTLLAVVDDQPQVAMVPVHLSLDLKALAKAAGGKKAQMAADARRKGAQDRDRRDASPERHSGILGGSNLSNDARHDRQTAYAEALKRDQALKREMIRDDDGDGVLSIEEVLGLLRAVKGAAMILYLELFHTSKLDLINLRMNDAIEKTLELEKSYKERDVPGYALFPHLLAR